MPTFVLNDENVINSYGFRVRNAGINFDRFDENPVMLDSHINKTDHVMGRWINRRIDGSLLKMDTEFDMELPAAKTLSGQVERKFVKGASPGLGIMFDDNCFERQPDGNWDLVKCEFMEGTICGVPSNSGALALYNKATGELIAENDIKLSLQKLTAEKVTPNTPKMEKIILSHSALSVLVGLNMSSENVTANSISEALIKLQSEVDAQKAKVTAAESKKAELQTRLDAQLKLQAEALIDGAITEGKLTAADREEYITNATENYKLTANLISKIPGKANLSGKISNSNSAAGEVKSIDDFEKLSNEKKLAFKADHPEEYRALFAKA